MQEFFRLWNLPLDFLFDSWKVTSTKTLIFTALAAFCVAFLFEGLRVASVTLHRKFFALPLASVPTNESASSTSSANTFVVKDSLDYVREQWMKNHLIQTFFHVIKVALSYGLMLSFMTYNAYIAIAILAGAAIGYFLFCHQIQVTHSKKACDSLSRTTTFVTSIDPSLHSLVNVDAEAPA
ncbi:protein SLC31A2-like [Clavelina lepadiformis]|uniref:Copper transport protein n=1 Tax=Clavelina lepadiformis TaxID=159417 RepID=A0ABP0F4H0_CLALP